MRAKVATLLSFVLLSVLPPAAFTQNGPPHLELFVEGGGSFLNGATGRFQQYYFPACPALCTPQGCACLQTPVLETVAYSGTFSKAPRLFAGARLRFTRHDAFEGSYSFSPSHLSLTTGSTTAGNPYTRVELVSFNYVRYLWAKTPVQPFATAGAGLSRFSGAGESCIAPFQPYGYVGFPCVSSSNGQQFAWNFGGGTDIVLQRRLALRLELRDYVTSQPAFLTGTSHNIVPSAGVAIRFK